MHSPFIHEEEIEHILIESGIIATRPFNWVKIGNCDMASKKVVFFLYEKHGRTPFCALKLGRYPVYAEKIECEFSIQKYLWNATRDHPFVARPIAYIRGDISPFYLETWLPGTSLLRLMYLGKHTSILEVRNDTRAILSQVYLPFLQTTIDPTINVDLREKYSRLRRLVAEECPELMISQDIQDQMSEVFRSDHSHLCPGSGRHGDFWLGNLLLDQERFYLIDWENYQSESYPYFDLYHYFVTLSLNYPGRNESGSEKFLQYFLKTDWFIEIVQNSLVEVNNYLGVSPAISQIAMSIFLLDVLMIKKKESSRDHEDFLSWLGITQGFYNHFKEFKDIYFSNSTGTKLA
jgi:hypothetical protein